MSDIDVRQLSHESLGQAAFPASNAAEFRVYFGDDVHTAISAHAAEDTSIEICGVLVGEWKKDADGPYAHISHFIRCNDAASKNTEVTFTHQSWSQINDEMDSKYSDKRIVGWYHSHPDFGIFLSDRDMFIQEHFFSGPGQIAYVVDPVRKVEGVFEWRSGKAELMERYWAGDRVIPVDAARSERSQRNTRAESVAADGATVSGVRPDAEYESPLPLSMMLLSGLGIFLVGMLLGQWRNSQEQRYLAEGAIVHYGLWNVMQLGRSEQIEAIRDEVSKSFDALTVLSEEQASKVEGDERKLLRERYHRIRKQLSDAREALQQVETRYSVPPEQRELLAQVVASHVAALSGMDTRKRLPVPVPQFAPQSAADGKPSQEAPKENRGEFSGPRSPDSGTGDGSAGKSPPAFDPNNLLPPPIGETLRDTPPVSANGKTPATKPKPEQ